ncbi:YALIA101S14e00936g1_1 [Yarrowia lipolytica]|nr:Tyrosyl-DNA phosphodiesterase 1 [Yarrowia lipolytica]SEI36800.1 YALIA101S14e00936g1_1 [Yarrowia lipolytica]
MDNDRVKRRKVESESDNGRTQLTAITALPDEENTGSVHLKDLIGSPHLEAMWQFNFMIDLAFVLDNIHKNAMSNIKCRFVMGDFSGEKIAAFRAQAKSLPIADNIEVGRAKLSNLFATHHTKMMVLFFKEDKGERSAQVVIHTANMIHHDWDNMTQGVWKSQKVKEKRKTNTEGSTSTFETDLVAYLSEYQLDTTSKLIKFLQRFDWSSETARVVGSVPGTHEDKKWGLTRVADLLDEHKEDHKSDYEGSESDTIVLQSSSIGSLGVTDKWITPQLVGALDGRSPRDRDGHGLPASQIVWPTVENVRRSFDGYDLGMSIHFKNESDTHRKQYAYMKERMNVWKADNKHRTRAMPHIKTYTRFTRAGKLRWVLLTSANISKYAWGSVSAAKEAKFSIPSWELGVLLFPQAVGKAVFDLKDSVIPYDWPLTNYSAKDEPWTKNADHLEKDTNGFPWVVTLDGKKKLMRSHEAL